MLHIVVYHYVRDLPRTPFPRIKGMLLEDFRRQVVELRRQYEMATLESALDFLTGKYKPRADLCLLTFDDGLKEHFTEVTPLLADHGIQGLFFLITSCLEDHRVAPVHMNHFLMATLHFEEYRQAFLRRLKGSGREAASRRLDPAIVQRTYPLDTPAVAEFKYLFNFILDPTQRDQAVEELFAKFVGGERPFARSLYLSWEEAIEMQNAGMVIGGHSHEHRPLATLGHEDLNRDLTTCRALLAENLRPQPVWPFCYPYGKNDSFRDATIQKLQDVGFDCAFTTESDVNVPGMDLFRINRVDCNRAPLQQTAGAAYAR